MKAMSNREQLVVDNFAFKIKIKKQLKVLLKRLIKDFV